MAAIANEVTVRVCMNERVSDLVRRLDALNPDTVSELVLTNFFVGRPSMLQANCSSLILEQLQHLEHLELSLVEDFEAVVDSEINNVRRLLATETQDVAVTHRLRRMYVEVGGVDRNFELLRELLAFCPDLTELHVNLVRGNFSNALSQCRRLHDDIVELGTFVFTSEVSVPFAYEPDSSSAFVNCATPCANLRHQRRSGDSWSCVELDHLPHSPHRGLPSQVVVVALVTDSTAESFRLASRRKYWTHVRELCILLLPLAPSIKFYPIVDAAYRDDLRRFFSVALEHVVELNLTSFHFHPDLDPMELLPEETLKPLHAFSAPPCVFPSAGGQFNCASCEPVLNKKTIEPPPDTVTSVVRSGVARLTVCDVPAHVQLWFLECCQVAVRVRLIEWPVSTRKLGYGYLRAGLRGNSAIRCLVLRHEELGVKDRQLQASLSRITTLQHLCLLTSSRVSHADASSFAVDFIAHMGQLKFLHMHYVCGSEQRVTWLRGEPRDGVLWQDRPCFACCSTATYIGLVKPINRDCEDL
ncbi:hypothetical protein MTO96_002190 [Rhipicephalus appendiculatus]